MMLFAKDAVRVGQALLWVLVALLAPGCVGGGLRPVEFPGGAEAGGKPVFHSVDAGRLKTGDEVEVIVFREPDFSGTFRVDASGAIRHSLWGSVAVGGLTVAEAEGRITELLGADFLVHPKVMVKLSQTQSLQVVILGAVKSPGVYAFPAGKPLTLLGAIAQAGGFTELASPDRVRVVRNVNGRQQTVRVRVARLLEGKSGEQDIDLLPDDVVDVPEAVF